MSNSFKDYIESKPLYYKDIDYERIHIAYDNLKDKISHPPAVHIIGTNAKGSTGRMIAYGANSKGLSVGHYSSPHILRFNERLWMNGEDVSDDTIEKAHQKLYSILGEEISDSLSYFEYTTLLALLIFEKCDLIVIEAGLGGEFDATNVLENRVLSVVTPIGYDHQSFLGDSIEEISRTKLNSIPPNSKVLLALQKYPEVADIAKEIADKKNCDLYFVTEDDVEAIKSSKWKSFLRENLATAIKALKILDIECDVEDFNSLDIFGRLYSVSDNIKIDVGHNPLAAKAIYDAIDEETVLIYNTLEDKDYKEVLSILKPKISRVEILPIDDVPRAVDRKELQRVIDEMGIPCDYFHGRLFKREKYLVFGSFYTVEKFLEWMREESED